MTSQGTNPPPHGSLQQRSSIGNDKNGTHNLQQQQHRKSSRISKKNAH